MNSSDSPASVEEKWTAYLDGRMSAMDAAAFEMEHSGAPAEKALVATIARAIARCSPAPVLKNADLFNQQILGEITPKQTDRSALPSQPGSLWSLWRTALAGAFCLLAAAAIYGVFVRGTDRRPDAYVAQVLSVKAGDDGLDATVLDAEGLAVVWIDGLEQLPNDYVLQ
jgi:anti-sigma factor RsiW